MEKTKTKQKPKKSFSSSKDKKEKKKFLDCVFLTEDEHQKLIDKNGIEITTKAIEVINNYKMSSGRNYKSDYHAILLWALSEARKRQTKRYSSERGATRKELSDEICTFCNKNPKQSEKRPCKECIDKYEKDGRKFTFERGVIFLKDTL